MRHKPAHLHLSHSAPEGAPLEVTAEPTGPKAVVVGWQAPRTDEQNGRLLSYTLEYSINGSLDAVQEISVPVDSSGGGNQERVVEGLQPYTTYQFRVRAVNEVGEGPFSNPVVIITLQDGKWTCQTMHGECNLGMLCPSFSSSWSYGVSQCNHSVIQCDHPHLDSAPFP